MMVSFCFRATGTRPFGESRITPAVRYLVDEVNRTLRYMAVSSAFYARPQKYILGLNDEQFDRMVEDKWSTYIGSVLLCTVNEQSGTAPTVGQLAASSPQPHIEAIQTYGKLFSGVTNPDIFINDELWEIKSPCTTDESGDGLRFVGSAFKKARKNFGNPYDPYTGCAAEGFDGTRRAVLNLRYRRLFRSYQEVEGTIANEMSSRRITEVICIEESGEMHWYST